MPTREIAAACRSVTRCGVGYSQHSSTAAYWANVPCRPSKPWLVPHTRSPGLKPVTTEPRDLFRNPLTARELDRYDAVIFDPPRAGAESQARELAQSKAPAVVAVSCDPATLARDLAILAEGGYRIDAVTPVDQFKYAAHVETVAVLRRG